MNNAAQLPDPHMDVATFLDWTAEAEGRWELDRGLPVQMQSERLAHLRAKGRVYEAFVTALAQGDLHCEALPDGASILTRNESVYIPDALIRCGDTLDADAIQVPDPVVIVEVLSPSNSLIEMTTKIDGYFSLPSVAWVLLVNTTTRIVHSYGRGEDALMLRRHVPGEALTLDPPGITLAVADLLPLYEEPAPEA